MNVPEGACFCEYVYMCTGHEAHADLSLPFNVLQALLLSKMILARIRVATIEICCFSGRRRDEAVTSRCSMTSAYAGSVSNMDSYFCI